MKFAVKRRSHAPVLALTSMLDVIFLLLCFFVTVSVYSQWEGEIDISLPASATADEPSRLPGEIIVNLDRDGALSVNSASITYASLGERLAKVVRYYPDQAVIIRADREVRYERLVQLLDVCREAGVWNFSFATEGDSAQ